jgi:hypothetical protein
MESQTLTKATARIEIIGFPLPLKSFCDIHGHLSPLPPLIVNPIPLKHRVTSRPGHIRDALGLENGASRSGLLIRRVLRRLSKRYEINSLYERQLVCA